MNKKNKIENLCNHPNCKEEGVYKAPLDYDNLSNYQWFCMEHIKEFNKKWNYHKKMDANEIENDITNTINTWEEIKNKAVKSIAPALVHEEGDVIKRALRDIYDKDTKNIIIEGNDGYQKAKNIMKTLMPENVKKNKKI